VTVKNRKIYIPAPVFNAHIWVTPSEFRKDIYCSVLGKLERLGYHVLKKVWRCVRPFRSNSGTWQTDSASRWNNAAH